MRDEISIKCNVYSYGIVLVEMLTHKWPTHEGYNDGFMIHKYVRHLFHGLKTLFTSSLLSSSPQPYLRNMRSTGRSYLKLALRVFKFGILCFVESPKEVHMYETATLALLYHCLPAAVLLSCLVFLTTNIQLSLWTACLLAEVRIMCHTKMLTNTPTW